MDHRRVACLHADVSGYSRLIADNVEQTVRMLTDCRNVFGRLVASHGGTVADVAGDSLLAAFPTVEAAVRCAIGLQRQLRVHNAGLPQHRRLELRVGIDTGDVLVECGRLYGNCVNVATRVQEVAAPGRICLPGSTLDHLPGPRGLEVQDLGERSLKHIDRPLRIFEVEEA